MNRQPTEQMYQRVARVLDGEDLPLSEPEQALLAAIREELDWARRRLPAEGGPEVVERASQQLREAIDAGQSEREWLAERVGPDGDGDRYEALAAARRRRDQRRRWARSARPWAALTAGAGVLAAAGLLIVAALGLLDPTDRGDQAGRAGQVEPLDPDEAEMELWLLREDAEMNAQLDALDAALAMLAIEDFAAGAPASQPGADDEAPADRPVESSNRPGGPDRPRGA